MREWLYQRFKRWAKKPVLYYGGVRCMGLRHRLARKISKRYSAEYDAEIQELALRMVHAMGIDWSKVKFTTAKIQDGAVTSVKVEHWPKLERG